MDKDSVVQGLRALARDKTKRTKAGFLREVLVDVEAALAAGVSQSNIVDELNKHGLDITLATFVTTLKRLRQQRNKKLALTTLQVPGVGTTTDPAVCINQEGADSRPLTRRERGQQVADKYLNTETLSPLTQRLLNKQREEKDESSGD
jgi:hypothetical protein